MRKIAAARAFLSTMSLSMMFSNAAFPQAAGPPEPHSLVERLKQAAPILVAHRGCVEPEPENSLAAIEACIAMGIDMVEGDVRATEDGVLVLLHDATLDRTTDATGRLKERSYSEVKEARLRMTSRRGEVTMTEERIPRLSDALETARGHVLFLLHVKEPVYDEIYDAVLAAGMQDDVALLIEASPRDSKLRKARFWGRVAYFPVVFQCEPPTRLSECYGIDHLRDVFDDYRPLHPTAYLFNFDSNAILERNAALIRKTGVKIIASADEEGSILNSDAIWGPLLAAKVSLILTDHAAELKRYLTLEGRR